MKNRKQQPMPSIPSDAAAEQFACLAEEPQMVTRRGAEEAVLVPVHEWRRLQAAARPSLKQLLLSEHARAELILPERGQAKRRSVEPMQ